MKQGVEADISTSSIAGSSSNSNPVSPNTNEGQIYFAFYQEFKVDSEATCFGGSSPKRERYFLKK